MQHAQRIEYSNNFVRSTNSFNCICTKARALEVNTENIMQFRKESLKLESRSKTIGVERRKEKKVHTMLYLANWRFEDLVAIGAENKESQRDGTILSKVGCINEKLDCYIIFSYNRALLLLRRFTKYSNVSTHNS